jgi:membrane protein DedA with SNARE-associated domain
LAVGLFSILILFLVSLGSNATPFFGASYTLIATTALLADGFSVGSFVLIVFVTAAGASLGKLVLYASGKGFRGRLGQNKTVMILGRMLERKTGLAVVFVTALTPGLPLDDYVYIGAGASSSRLTGMFIVTFLAKVLKGFLEIGIEYAGLGRLYTAAGLTGLSRMETSVLFSVVFLIVGVVFYKIDLEKLISRLKHQVKPADAGQTPGLGSREIET